PEARRQHAQALITLLDAVFAAADAAAWRARFEEHDVPFAILPTYPEIAADAQAAAAGMFPALVDAPRAGMRTVDGPIRLPDDAGRPRRAAPALGAHTAEVLAELGFTDAQIADAHARGVVAGPRGGGPGGR